MLTSLGLAHPPQNKATKKDILSIIKRVGQLQIDTIHVVARSHYLVLWSRIGNYNPKWLDELLEDKKVFEYWSHAMCFLPIEDYPLYRRLMLEKKGRWGARTERWFGENEKTVAHVLEHIKQHGETKSSDFKRTDGKKGSWWDWKAEKVALEVLFDRGDLMIARRNNFHRVYNMREKVHTVDDSKLPNYETVQKELTIKAIKALGVATSEWISDYFYTPKREIANVLERLRDEKEIYEVKVENLGRCFIHKSIKNFDTAKPTHTTLLSPFDPLMNNRKRVKKMFDFDYQIECYTPKAKRKYGYFTLPILHRGKLIGRLDPKAFRKEKVFEVKSIHLEPSVKITDEMVADVAKAIQDCANWHETPEVVIRKSNPKGLINALKTCLCKI